MRGLRPSRQDHPSRSYKYSDTRGCRRRRVDQPDGDFRQSNGVRLAGPIRRQDSHCTSSLFAQEISAGHQPQSVLLPPTVLNFGFQISQRQALGAGLS